MRSPWPCVVQHGLRTEPQLRKHSSIAEQRLLHVPGQTLVEARTGTYVLMYPGKGTGRGEAGHAKILRYTRDGSCGPAVSCDDLLSQTVAGSDSRGSIRRWSLMGR